MSNDETRVVGWKLARRVADSDLYDQLTDLERAECDELIERGNGWEGPPDRQSPAGISCRISRCQYQADCSRIRYCQATIFQSSSLRNFVTADVMTTLKRLREELEQAGTHDKVLSELTALHMRNARTV